MKSSMLIGIAAVLTVAGTVTVTETSKISGLSGLSGLLELSSDNASAQSSFSPPLVKSNFVETANIIVKNDRITVYDRRPQCYAVWGYGTDTIITIEQTTNGVECTMSGKWVSVDIKPDDHLVIIGD